MPVSRRLALALLIACFAFPALAEDNKKKKEEAPPPATGKVTSLFDGKSLDGWKSTNFGGEAEVKVQDGQILLGMGDPLTGITYQKGDKLPKDHYEITLEANKLDGDDFFCGLTFPVRDSHCSLIVGGWAGGIVGISNIDGLDASENETTTYDTFKRNHWYKIRVRVDGDKLQAWIDGKKYVDVNTKDRKLDTRIEVDQSKPLGIACYITKTALRNIKVQEL
jgi:hypothetical protein